MAQVLNKLRSQSLKTLPVGKHGDGGGLWFVVTPKGRSFVFIYIRGKRRVEMGLGGLGGTSLAGAREIAAQCRDQLSRGVDPLEARRAAKPKSGVPSLGEMAARVIEAKSPGWRDKRAVEAWRATLSLDKDRTGKKLKGFCQSIVGKPVDAITVDDILGVLRPIWIKKHVTASRIRERLWLVLAAAESAGHRPAGKNPAEWRGHLENLLPRVKHTKRHHAALNWRDVPGYVRELQANKSVRSLALQFTLLCAVRTGETIGAVWREIDMEAGVWTIPAARMKADRDHRVPLSPAALRILDEMETLRPERCDGSSFVFPGAKDGKPLSINAMRKLMREDLPAGEATVHGTARSSFRDWCADNGHDRDLAEASLAHVLGDDTERAYARSDMLERRRPLMRAWAAFITGTAPQPAQAPATEAREPAPGLAVLTAFPGLAPANGNAKDAA